MLCPNLYPFRLWSEEELKKEKCLGMTGGISAAIQARGLLVELGSPPVQVMVNIPTVQNAIDEDGTLKDERIEKNLGKY